MLGGSSLQCKIRGTQLDGLLHQYQQVRLVLREHIGVSGAVCQLPNARLELNGILPHRIHLLVAGHVSVWSSGVLPTPTISLRTLIENADLISSTVCSSSYTFIRWACGHTQRLIGASHIGITHASHLVHRRKLRWRVLQTQPVGTPTQHVSLHPACHTHTHTHDDTCGALTLARCRAGVPRVLKTAIQQGHQPVASAKAVVMAVAAEHCERQVRAAQVAPPSRCHG